MAIPTTPPADHATLFGRERGHLLDLLRGLGAKDWSRPTPCPGWDVLGLACHLVGDDLGVLARQRDGHAGPVGPRPADDPDGFIRWLDALQQQWVVAAERLSPRLVIDLLEWTGPQMIAMFRSQDPTAVEASVSWASFDPVPRWLDHARELSEHWLHRQQLRDALGRRDDHDAEVLGAVLDALRWAWPHGLRDVGTPGDAATVRIHGTSEATWHLQRQADGWAFTDDPAVTPALTADLDAEDAWRLLSNNDRRDRLAVDGRPELVRAFARSRAIIGRPQ